MDLKEYERAKFELAEILRSVALLSNGQRPEDVQRLRELFARLAEDRFNLVVVGRFSRGKSSLMNAILGTDRLPVGIVPLTSVITTVAYGSKEQVIIHYQGGRLSSEASIELLPEYVTQMHNPGNARQVKMAEVRLPIEILRRGFYFVDTPGLGSPSLENTRTTEGFLPEADAFLLVTSYESPLSGEELRILRAASSSARRVFVVVNKQDLVSREERSLVLRYLREQLAESVGQNVPRVFSVSAREGLEAKRSQDATQLAASGVPELEAELVRFLLAEKSAEFLLRLCDRIADLAQEWAPPSAEATRLKERLHSLAKRIAQDGPAAAHRVAETVKSVESNSLHGVRPCEICERILHAVFDFLCQYQYDLSARSDVQQGHARHGGLCGPHTWQYASLASPQGICTGYPTLLERLAECLRSAASAGWSPAVAALQIHALLPTVDTCVLCCLRAKVEAEAISSIVDRLKTPGENGLSSLSAICILHLSCLIAAIGDASTRRELLEREAEILTRIAEDMRRYATKHDAIRRVLANDEELEASQRALCALIGLRNANAAAPTR